jgi:MFS family permease
MRTPFARLATGLWREPDFLKLWTGQTVSLFGSQITGTALQLTALLVLGASPAQMGLLAAIVSAPVLVFGLVAGVWVDRLRRRPVLIAADLIRAGLLATIPLAALLGQLRMAHLFIVAPLAGVLTVFFDVAFQSYVPTLVGRERIVEANGKLGVSASLSEVTGAGVAGVLVQLLTAPVAILIDAGSFVASAALLLAVRRPEKVPAKAGLAERNAWRELREGAGYLVHNPSLRAMAGHDLIRWFFGNFFAGLYALFCLRELGLSPVLIGLTVAGGGVGNLLGALAAPGLTRRLGLGRATLLALGVGGLVSFLIPLAGGSLWLAFALVLAAQFVGDGFAAVYEIGSLSVRQAVTPDALLGRVNGSMYLITAGLGPLGAVVGGLLAEAIGVRATLFIAVTAGALSGLWIVFSPIRKLDRVV